MLGPSCPSRQGQMSGVERSGDCQEGFATDYTTARGVHPANELGGAQSSVLRISIVLDERDERGGV